MPTRDSGDSGRDRERRRGRSGKPVPGKSAGGRSSSRREGPPRTVSSGGTGRRGGADAKRSPAPKRRKDLTGAAAALPNWVVEALARVTPAQRVAGALDALGQASEALAAGRFHVAVRQAQRAKELSPRDTTIRETLGLASYRVGDWATALAELRAFRRMSGEATHLPIEMDVLRALDRPDDVAAAWMQLKRLEVGPAVAKEGKVVYGSFLIDTGQAGEAYELMKPGRLRDDPFPEDLRVWYVAARAAALVGNTTEAVRLRNAILEADPAFPGMDELEASIAR